MAIKGKKKKQRSGPRRPAGAPRALQSATRPEPWHAKPGVRIGIALGAAFVLILVTALVMRSGDGEGGSERRRDGIERFTGDVQALLQRVSPTAAEMVAATPDMKNLDGAARRWDETLTQVQEDMATVVASAPPELDAANRLVFQSVLQYIAAAKTYVLVPDAKGKMGAKIAERASAQVAAAEGTWLAAVSVIDQERSDAGLSVSGLRAPSQVAAPAPTPTGG
jgi:hypothetical protein